MRGGATETIEGTRQPLRLVIIEFADAEHFSAWYDSPEYAEVRATRFNASRAQALLAHGVDQRPRLCSTRLGALSGPDWSGQTR